MVVLGTTIGRYVIRISASLFGCPSVYTDYREMPTRYLQTRHTLPLPTVSPHHSWTNLFLTWCYVTPAVEPAPIRQYCFHFYSAKRLCGRSKTHVKLQGNCVFYFPPCIYKSENYNILRYFDFIRVVDLNNTIILEDHNGRHFYWYSASRRLMGLSVDVRGNVDWQTIDLL